MINLSSEELITLRDDLSRQVKEIETILLDRHSDGELLVTAKGKHFRVEGFRSIKFVGKELSEPGGSNE